MTRLADRWPVLNALEALCGLPLGVDEAAPVLPPTRGVGWRTAIDEVIVPALERAPCFVSFSGGRDSSAVLALAVDVARRHGLALPIPTILRFPGLEETDETEWQDVVLAHLALKERCVLELTSEIDVLGAAGTSVLLRYGLRWPANTYIHAPMFEHARGGSMLTGVGGDELFETRATSFVLVAHLRQRPRRRDAAALAAALLPRSARAALALRRRPDDMPWLTPPASRRVARALTEDEVSWPNRWDRALRQWVRSRVYQGVRFALPAIAEDFDVRLTNPLVEPSVLAEVLPLGGATGFRSREAALELLVGDLVPARVRSRTSKAAFTRAVFGPRSREFAERWDGGGLDGAIVDAERLRRAWLADVPDVRTAFLLQAAWLRSEGKPTVFAPR